MLGNDKIKDEILIKNFQDGDTSAFDVLVNRYKDRIYNFIYRFVYDVDLAQDLTQDTFVKLFTHKNSYKEIAKFSNTDTGNKNTDTGKPRLRFVRQNSEYQKQIPGFSKRVWGNAEGTRDCGM